MKLFAEKNQTAQCKINIFAAVATVATVAAVAMSVTNMPIAHYHLENISREMHFLFDILTMACPASGTYPASSAAKFYS